MSEYDQMSFEGSGEVTPSSSDGATMGREGSSPPSERRQRGGNTLTKGYSKIRESPIGDQLEKNPVLKQTGALEKTDWVMSLAALFTDEELAKLIAYISAQNYVAAGKLAFEVIGPEMMRELADSKDSKVLDALATATEKAAEVSSHIDIDGGDGPPGGASDGIEGTLPDEGMDTDQLPESPTVSPAGDGGAGDDESIDSGPDSDSSLLPPPINKDGMLSDGDNSSSSINPLKSDDNSDKDKPDQDKDDDEDNTEKHKSSKLNKVAVLIALAPVVMPLVMILLLVVTMTNIVGGGGESVSGSDTEDSIVARESVCQVDEDAGFTGVSEPQAEGTEDSEMISGGVGSNKGIEGLDDTQSGYARKIYDFGKKDKVAESLIKAALITSIAETDLHNYANDGESATRPSYKKDISSSTDEENDGVELQGNALGLFGLTYPQWGEVSDLMNVTKATKKFFEAGSAVTGYKDKKPLELAEKVMGSPSPEAYSKAVKTSDRVYKSLESDNKKDKGGKNGGNVGGLGKGELIQPMGKGRFTQTSGFGMRDGGMHDGADWASSNPNEPMFAVADAKVVKAEPASGYGNWVILGVTLSGGEYIEALYGHMSAENIFVKAGQTVTGGQKIALQGTEGYSTGPHLHFGIYPGGWSMGGGVDPMPYMMKEALPIGSDGNLDTSSVKKGSPKKEGTTETAGKYGKTGEPWDFLDNSKYSGGNINGFDQRQMINAREIVRQTEAMNMSRKASEVALSTAMQESTLLIYANSSVPVSLKEPHQAVGQDHDSVGLFQQRYPMWSEDVRQLMTPWSSTELFLKGLKDVQGWESMPVTVAAQTVQRSAFPDAYAPHEPIAKQLTEKFYDGSGKGKNPGKLAKDEGGKDYNSDDASDDFTSPDTTTFRYVSDTYCVDEEGNVFTVDDQFGTENQFAYTPAGLRGDDESDYEDSSDSKKKGKKSTDVEPSGDTGKDIAQYALSKRGTPYAWGGGDKDGPTKGIHDGGTADQHGDFNKVGFDCSGLVLWAVYKGTKGKVELPHHTTAQLKEGKEIPMDKIETGDVVYFGGSKDSVEHTAIYIGDGKIVHAPQSGDVVKVSDLKTWPGPEKYVVRFG